MTEMGIPKLGDIVSLPGLDNQTHRYLWQYRVDKLRAVSTSISPSGWLVGVQPLAQFRAPYKDPKMVGLGHVKIEMRMKPGLPIEREKCSYCGTFLDKEDAMLLKKRGPLICPSCMREGCSQCMPEGRGIICPDCEQERGR